MPEILPAAVNYCNVPKFVGTLAKDYAGTSATGSCMPPAGGAIKTGLLSKEIPVTR